MIEHETGIPWADTPAPRPAMSLIWSPATPLATPDRLALVEPGPDAPRVDLDATRSARSPRSPPGSPARLVAGHRLGLSGPNSIEFVLAYLGALRAGFVAVPLNPQLTAAGLPQMLEYTGTHVLLAASRPKITGRAAPPADRGRRARPRGCGRRRGHGELAAGPGVARGAALHRGHLRRPQGGHAQPSSADQPPGPDAGSASWTPTPCCWPRFRFCHVFGLNAVLGSWLRSGARLVIMDGFDRSSSTWSRASRSPTCRSLRR